MKIKKHYKLVIGFIVIFLSGMLSGGGIAYYIIREHDRQTDPLEKFRTQLFKTMVRDLKLTDKQQIQVRVLLNQAIKRMKAYRLKHAPEIMMIIRENHEGMAKILTPEQWKIYQGYRLYKLKKIQKDIP
jgi:hypothetical protein